MRILPMSLFAAALALFVGAASLVHAADAPAAPAATGTVTGKVVDADGKGVSGANVVILPAPTGEHKKHSKQDADGKGEKKKGHGQDAVAKGTTSDDGSFKIDVAPGTYGVAANLPGKGRGHATAPVTVVAGQSVDAGIITLSPPKNAGGDKAPPAAPKQ